MSEQLAKSLIDLIDETIAEIETLKKSDGRFATAEVNLKGPGEGIDGAPVNGKLGKDEDKDEHEASETAEEEEAEEEAKAKMKKEEEDEEEAKKKKAKEEMDKAEKDGINVEKKELPETGYAIKKSQDEMNTLMKSYVDEKVKPLETKIDSLVNLVQQIANQPVASKSVSYKDLQPLHKSEESAILSKSEVANKLFELKKSGQPVDSLDIAQAELGTPATLQKIVAKYNIK